MKWYALYKKIAKQPIKITQKANVIAIVDGKEIPLLLKFKENGEPYLISKEEYNYNQCKECFNYNIGDGYDDISKCLKCNYYNK